jgi:hypothetical protein
MRRFVRAGENAAVRRSRNPAAGGCVGDDAEVETAAIAMAFAPRILSKTGFLGAPLLFGGNLLITLVWRRPLNSPSDQSSRIGACLRVLPPHTSTHGVCVVVLAGTG